MSYGFTERRIYVVSIVPKITAGPSVNLTKERTVGWLIEPNGFNQTENYYEHVRLTIIKLILCYAGK